ncbi:heavy-metal-associated domain-containing protein [Streptomyces pseudoechinosporeus]
MTESTYTVSGMVCEHCAGFVTEEIEHVAGVTAVAVNVDSGTVTVTSDRDLDIADVRAAVEEAGYELDDRFG